MVEGAVRRAEVADADVLGKLLYDFNTEFDTPTPTACEFALRFRRLLTDAGILALLFENLEHRACGFALLSLRPTPYFDGPLVQVEELYVIPEFRDRGMGTALLQSIVDLARNLGSEEIHIGVDEIDTDTRRFYERYDFVNIQPGESYRMLMYVREL